MFSCLCAHQVGDSVCSHVMESPGDTKKDKENSRRPDTAVTAVEVTTPGVTNAGADDEADPVVTLEEAFADMDSDTEALEEDARALLGGEDATICSYDQCPVCQGCRSRQPLYACRTCSAKSGRQFGVCLGCSYECHDAHDLVELYTKRRFTCDCGNSRCPDGFTCKLCPTKRRENEDNRYNHNFDGLYCTCERPYPDEEDDVKDSMLQCVVCEDWMHSRHLSRGGVVLEDARTDSELACARCIRTLPFLRRYAVRYALADEIVDVEGTEEGASAKSTISQDGGQAENPSVGEQKDKSSADAIPTASAPKSNVVECQLKMLPSMPEENDVVETVFWQEGWRNKLCRCVECVRMYERLECDFLIDPEDPVDVYVARAKEKSAPENQNQATSSAASGASGGGRADVLSTMARAGLDRVQQVEVLRAMNSFKEDLSTFFESASKSGKNVISEADVREFFEQRLAAKRPRLDGVPPDNCHF